MPAVGSLLERERELELIAASVKRAKHARDGSLLLVEGVAGIGKTALVDEARTLAADAGLTVLAASGDELERELPYGVVVQLFEAIMRDGDRDELLAGAAELAAGVVAPRETAERERIGGDPFGVLHGLYWLTVNVAARVPVLIAVDDVHWADGPSLRFLAYLARRLEGLAVAVVLAGRPAEPQADRAVLAALWGQPHARILRPAGLSEGAMTRLIERAFGETPDAAFVGACRAATGGTPFLVDELAGALAADGVRPNEAAAAGVHEFGPATVAHATLLRLARLSAAAAPLARAIAVLGSEARLDRAARLAQLDESEALEAVDALAAVQILRAERSLEFAHPIVRAAVYDDLSAGRRSALHGHAAELLAAEGADLDAVAAHLLLTEPTGKVSVVEQLRAAAGHARARGAPETAAAYLGRALEEGAGHELRVALLHELATAEKLLRDPTAITHLEEAMALTGDPVERARAAIDLAEILTAFGQWDRFVVLLEPALTGLGDRDSELALRLHTLRAGVAAFDPRLVGELEPQLPRLRALVEQGTPAGRGLALLLAGIAGLRGERLEQIAPLVARGLDDGRFLVDEGSESTLCSQAIGLVGLVLSEQLGRADDLAEQMHSDARARGSVYGVVQAVVSRAWVQARRGDLVSAEADLRTGLDLAHEYDLRFAQPIALWYGADAILERPALDDIAALAQTLELDPGLSETLHGAVLLEVRGRLRLLRGNAAGAIDDLRHCGQTLDALGMSSSSGWRSALALALSGEDRDQALELASAELSDARRVGLPRAIGVALRTRGVLEPGERGLAHLRNAVEVLQGSPARLEHARALVELGAALRRANQRAAARDPLRQGLDLAHRCGATRLADRARSELKASGAKPRRQAASGVEALTASERRVAEMAATGTSNPQIAQALFVTLNTVETHLRHVYQKLGINRREHLDDALDPCAATPLNTASQKLTVPP